MSLDLKRMYRTIQDDPFPASMEIRFGEGATQAVLRYEKMTWDIDGERRGLRYGENPDQPAAVYRLKSASNTSFAGVELIRPGQGLVTAAELLQSGKHPSKINLTDVDNALNILRYLDDKPAAAVMKHNNPSGVALGSSVEEAYERAHMADPVAAFGGAVVLNGAVDIATAEALAERYVEVVAAPSYDEGVVGVLAARKNLRIMRIVDIERLREWAPLRFLDFKALMDGAVVVQTSFLPIHHAEMLLPAVATHKGKEYRTHRSPEPEEFADMIFGWIVEAGVTSNSVIYVSQGVTVGIGTGEQDRVGVAEIARDKAYRKMADRLAFTRHGKASHEIDPDLRAGIALEVRAAHGGLTGATMVSDGFFPFRDGVDVGLREGVTAVIQPGGSLNDWQVIEAVNEVRAAMMFTGQRSFRH